MPENELSLTFGKNLNRFLRKSNMSQQELIAALHSFGIKVGAASVSYWCNGKKIPRPDKIDALCRIFHCKRRDLLEDPDSKDVPVYYTNSETAALAQEMFEDPDMQTLYDLKRTMGSDRFKAHVKFMKDLYDQEHPDSDEGC